MKQDIKPVEQDDSEIPQNPYQELTEAELSCYIDQSKKDMDFLEERTYQRAAQQVTSRNDLFLKNVCDIRNGIFELRRRVGQIDEVLQNRMDSIGGVDSDLVNEWKKMRSVCFHVRNKSIDPLEQVIHIISDYHYAFPNEKSSFLKKLGQVSGVTSVTTIIAGFFFGDGLKAKAIAAGGGFVLGTVLVNMEKMKGQSAPRRPLEAYEIRQAYSYLS